MNQRVIILIFQLFICIFTVLSQERTVLDTSNYNYRKRLCEIQKKEHTRFLKKLQNEYSKKELSYAIKIYEDINKDFSEDILKGNFIFETKYDTIINSVYNRLKSNNQSVNQSIEFYISRDISLNALSTSENRIILNLGSFYFLRNRDELASIIAHEIAHNTFNHQVKSIKFSYHQDKVDAKISTSDIKKCRYGRGSRALEKYKSLKYASSQESRKAEFEADSLGYVIYRDAGFNVSNYMTAFRLMFEYDTIKALSLDTSIYKKVFDLPEQPYKDSWLKMEDFGFYDYSGYKNRLNSDSIKSHPELDERISKLEYNFPELKTSATKDRLQLDSAYIKLRKETYYELFQSIDLSEDYGFGVFICLCELADTENSEDIHYYNKWLGKYFTKILKARKEYTLNRYMDRVDPKDQSLDYQQFLNFMWNLKQSELEIIANHFSK